MILFIITVMFLAIDGCDHLKHAVEEKTDEGETIIWDGYWCDGEFYYGKKIMRHMVQEGFWKNDQLHGWGHEITDEGVKKEGKWVRGKLLGYVIEISSEGKKREGTYKYGGFNGYVTIIRPYGDKQEGTYKDGAFNGYKTFIDMTGGKQEGTYKDGAFNGYTTIIDTDGRKREGTFKDIAFNGYMTVIFPNGEKKEGTIKNGAFNGYMTVILPDGSKQKGTYRNKERVFIRSSRLLKTGDMFQSFGDDQGRVCYTRNQMNCFDNIDQYWKKPKKNPEPEYQVQDRCGVISEVFDQGSTPLCYGWVICQLDIYYACEPESYMNNLIVTQKYMKCNVECNFDSDKDSTRMDVFLKTFDGMVMLTTDLSVKEWLQNEGPIWMNNDAHAMLLVGWDNKGWKIKNTWGDGVITEEQLYEKKPHYKHLKFDFWAPPPSRKLRKNRA